MSTLTVMCGLPASGKSTYAATLYNVSVLSADAIRVERANAARVFGKLFQQTAAQLAAANVVVDSCALYAGNRRALYQIGRNAGARVELVIMCTPWHVCKDRDAKRGAQRALVDWDAQCKQGVAMLRAVPSEGWDVVSYVPREMTASRLFT